MRLLLTLVAMLIALPAYAQQTPTPPAPGAPAGPGQPPANLIAEPVALMIAAFDSDGDARVTRAEFDAGLRHSFDLADPQHKGNLSYIGFSDWAETWLGNRNALPSPFEADADGDNRITFAELSDRFALFFARFDANKDGVIVRSELVRVGPPQMIRFDGRRRRDGQQHDE
ncbi:EF-hand domain-containing protein [Sphingomonas sp. LB-2]|uniref:EF-hand domain-containing protein n=1 Tax=Sphingomonas caeni TaxID=2984949 RepID=UPI00223242DD|nr:EF-hand domain-containing protein [Sphingomonas caeni]MCW3845904.1 EF-hand domain-containing protein [Sphingomonas caeni]